MPSGTSFFTSFSPAWKYRSFEPFSIASSEPMPRYDLNLRPLNSIVSPGASSVPATRLPIITLHPPAARALTTSPEYLRPPSAMSGMSVSFRAWATSYTALSCGTPTPATTRVVHIEPGPIPTFTASAPALASILAASPVAILPTTMSTSGKCCLASFTFSITERLWPCAVSMTMASTPAATSAAIRSRVSDVTPTPAATRRRPFSSLHAIGLSFAFVMSLYVIKPMRCPCSSTTGSFSILCCRRICEAESRSVC